LHDESGALESELAKLKAVEHRITVLDTAVSLKTAETRSLLVQGDPFLDIANGALELVNRQELGDLAVLTKPPDGVEEVFAAITVLLAGKLPQIFVQKSGRVKERDRSWSKVKTSVLGNINAFIEELTKFRAYAEEGSLHKVNLREVRQYLLLETFKPDVVERGSEVAGALCAWVINIVAYCDVIDSVEPFRLDLDKLKSELGQRVHDRLAIESEISIMTAKKEKLTALYTSAAAASEEALRLTDNSELKLELARKLLAELASERRDWSERAKQIDKEHFRELV
jgi:dynein heavy chain